MAAELPVAGAAVRVHVFGIVPAETARLQLAAHGLVTSVASGPAAVAAVADDSLLSAAPDVGAADVENDWAKHR